MAEYQRRYRAKKKLESLEQFRGSNNDVESTSTTTFFIPKGPYKRSEFIVTVLMGYFNDISIYDLRYINVISVTRIA
jgi:hypothetical protein